MPPSHFRIRIRKFCPRSVLRIHVLLLIFVFSLVFLFHHPHSNCDDDAIPPHVDTFRLVDDLLDEALDISLSNTQNFQDGRLRVGPRGADARPPRASTYQFPLVSSALQVDLDTLRAQVCRILQGKSIFLVGPHETLYQLHSYLLTVLHPDRRLGSTIAPTMRPSCPGVSTLALALTLTLALTPFMITNLLLLPTFSQQIVAAATAAAAASYDSFNSGNLNPSPTQEDVRLSVPSVDPRTSVRVIDSRWVRYASSSKADIIVLNRGPLPAPAWSYNNNNNNNNNNCLRVTNSA
ncbi:hypothetical protein F5888DRAFT_1804131 [Russula emetica]|nr:hypothetical protein F5888DRAFT_1804131 [Russula emetica]